MGGCCVCCVRTLEKNATQRSVHRLAQRRSETFLPLQPSPFLPHLSLGTYMPPLAITELRHEAAALLGRWQRHRLEAIEGGEETLVDLVEDWRSKLDLMPFI